jgi:hypothetical protein
MAVAATSALVAAGTTAEAPAQGPQWIDWESPTFDQLESVAMATASDGWAVGTMPTAPGIASYSDRAG